MICGFLTGLRSDYQWRSIRDGDRGQWSHELGPAVTKLRTEFINTRVESTITELCDGAGRLDDGANSGTAGTSGQCAMWIQKTMTRHQLGVEGALRAV